MRSAGEHGDRDSHKWHGGLTLARMAFGSSEEWGDGAKGGRGVGVFFECQGYN